MRTSLSQALLEATAKGSYGARMPRQQQGGLGPASMARPGGHMPPDARVRSHMLGGQPPRPILTGAATAESIICVQVLCMYKRPFQPCHECITAKACLHPTTAQTGP